MYIHLERLFKIPMSTCLFILPSPCASSTEQGGPSKCNFEKRFHVFLMHFPFSLQWKDNSSRVLSLAWHFLAPMLKIRTRYEFTILSLRSHFSLLYEKNRVTKMSNFSLKTLLCNIYSIFSIYQLIRLIGKKLKNI